VSQEEIQSGGARNVHQAMARSLTAGLTDGWVIKLDEEPLSELDGEAALADATTAHDTKSHFRHDREVREAPASFVLAKCKCKE
jgi:hypothetical protein